MKLTATVGIYVITAITISVTTAQRPNIIFIVADDLGWNDVSWHNPEVIMPHLDKMARSGVILNSSYVQPMCSPSRNSFMSGYYPYHTGLQHFVILAAQPTGLPLDVTLLPQRLKELGYNTHIIGKWHLGFCKWDYTPTFRGFDSFLGYYTSQENYVTHTRNYHHFKGVDFHLNTEPELLENGTFSPYIFVRRTEQILQSHNKSNPLFLYLPLQSVHAPLQVPKRFEDLYPNVKNVTRRKKLGMITFLDETVANVTQLLDAGGFLDNALIIFTTDNGGPVWFGANNLPLRGAKTTLWEGGTRGVALVHSQTLLKKTGYTNNGMMHAVDWFPTILEVAGGAPQPGIDGVSMWSTLSQGAPSPRTEFLYNIDDIYKNAALRQGDFKLIEGSPGNYSDWYPLPGETTPAIDLPDQMTRPVENVTKYRLYNIRDDPAERIDLSTSHTDIVAKMVDRLNEYRKSSHAARYPPDDPKGDPRNFGGVWSPGWC